MKRCTAATSIAKCRLSRGHDGVHIGPDPRSPEDSVWWLPDQSRTDSLAAMAAKKKPGKNIPNAQRHTVQRLLRLPPEVDERLVEIAEEHGLTVAGAVGLLIEEHDGER